MTYPMTVAGLRRDLPICKVTDDLYIGAFIVFGDAELTVACARELLKLVPAEDYDYMLTAEAKSIPLIHEMARQSGAKKYFIARKGPKAYMPDPIHVEKGAPRVSGAPGLSSLKSFTVPSAWNTGSFSRNLMSLRSAASPSARTATRPVTVPPARATSCSMA